MPTEGLAEVTRRRGGTRATWALLLGVGLGLGQQAPRQAEAPRLGAAFAAPRGARLESYRGQRHVLLVAGPDGSVWQPAAAELAKLETALVTLAPDRETLQPIGAWDLEAKGPRPTAFLIDRDGRLRWIERALSGPADLVRVARRWDRGKWTYDSQCARCHGADGNDRGYAPNIKTLGGIGNRMTPAQILEATAATGVVSFSGWSREELDALALYVAGL